MEETINENELQIAEPNQFQFNKQEGFSHQLCVQKAYYKVIDALSVEMTEGFWQEIKDKHGNKKLIYQADTRRIAIENIKTLKNVMIADLKQTIYYKRIKILLTRIKEIKQKFIQEQLDWWERLPYANKQAYQGNNLTFNPNYFYDKLPYWHEFLSRQVDLFRMIFEQLELCLENRRYLKKAKQTNLVNKEGYEILD